MFKQFLREYLSFTKKERTGIFILLALIIICLFVPFLYPYFIRHKTCDHSHFDTEIAQLKIQEADILPEKYYFNKNFEPDSVRNTYPNYSKPSKKNFYRKTKAEIFFF